MSKLDMGYSLAFVFVITGTVLAAVTGQWGWGLIAILFAPAIMWGES